MASFLKFKMNMKFVVVFQLCLHSYQAMVLIQHFQIPYLYKTLKKVFASHTDLFDNYDRFQRKELCDMLLQANAYRLSSDRSPKQKLADSENDRDYSDFNFQEIGYHQDVTKETLEYKETIVEIIPNDFQRVKLFPCFERPSFSLYATYGFIKKNAFVILKSSATRKFQIYGLLESDPTFDETFIHPREYMNNYFWKYTGIDKGENIATAGSSREVPVELDSPTSSVKEETPKDSNYVCSVPNDVRLSLSIEDKFPGGIVSTNSNFNIPPNMTLNSISELQYIRICASIADKIANYGVFQLTLKKQNFVQPLSEFVTGERSIIKDDRSMKINADALPCAIRPNRSWHTNRTQFYLLRNTNLEASVFVFRPIEDATYGELLRIECRIDDLIALEDVEEQQY